MGRILVYPSKLEQASQMIRDTENNFRQLTEKLTRAIEQASWESAQKAQLEQSLREWQRISRALVEMLGEQARFLSRKAKEFRHVDETTANSIMFGAVVASVMPALAYSKLQNVKGAKISNPKMTFDFFAPLGGGMDKWKENPAGSILAAAGTIKDGTESAQLVKRHRAGFRVNPYVNNQGEDMVRFTKRTLLKDGDGHNLIRKTKLPLEEALQVDEVRRYLESPGTLAADSLKFKNNALGYIGAGLELAEDSYDNWKDDAPASKFIADAAVDVGVGVGTTAGSTYVGAAVGTAIGGPLGTAIGGAIGFGVSVGASYIFDGIEFEDDKNGDGEADSVKDRLKLFMADKLKYID
ncbi:MAG: hypothetical protein ACE3JP_16300 [Ectobacillus sp.]